MIAAHRIPLLNSNTKSHVAFYCVICRYTLNALFTMFRTRPSLQLVRLHALEIKTSSRGLPQASLYIGKQLFQARPTTACNSGFSPSNSATKVMFRKRSLLVVDSPYVCVYFLTTNALARREKVAVEFFVHCYKPKKLSNNRAIISLLLQEDIISALFSYKNILLQNFQTLKFFLH